MYTAPKKKVELLDPGRKIRFFAFKENMLNIYSYTLHSQNSPNPMVVQHVSPKPWNRENPPRPQCWPRWCPRHRFRRRSSSRFAPVMNFRGTWSQAEGKATSTNPRILEGGGEKNGFLKKSKQKIRYIMQVFCISTWKRRTTVLALLEWSTLKHTSKACKTDMIKEFLV